MKPIVLVDLEGIYGIIISKMLNPFFSEHREASRILAEEVGYYLNLLPAIVCHIKTIYEISEKDRMKITFKNFV